jgi:hypothetical protein
LWGSNIKEEKEKKMKRLLILCLTVMFTFVLGNAAMASTMGVNVSKGAAIDIERYLYDDSDSDYWMLWGNYAPNDKILFKLGYAFEDDDFSDELTFGIRYEIIKNLALVADYTTIEDTDDDIFGLGFRGKINLNKNVDLTGELMYHSHTDADDIATFWGQGEFKVSEYAVLNAGFGFDDLDHVNDDTVYGILGAEFYLKKVCIYMDYYIYEDSDLNSACVGVEIAF